MVYYLLQTMQEHTKYMTNLPAFPAGHVTTSRAQFFPPSILVTSPLSFFFFPACAAVPAPPGLFRAVVQCGTGQPSSSGSPAPFSSLPIQAQQTRKLSFYPFSGQGKGTASTPTALAQHRHQQPIYKLEQTLVQHLPRQASRMGNRGGGEHPSPTTSLLVVSRFATPRFSPFSLQHILKASFSPPRSSSLFSPPRGPSLGPRASPRHLAFSAPSSPPGHQEGLATRPA